TPPDWPRLEAAEPDRVLRVWSKRDHVVPHSPVDEAKDYIELSVKTGYGLSLLEKHVLDRLLGSDNDGVDAEMSRVRHAENLRKALQATRLARAAFADGMSGDLVMVDLRDALSYIGEILGERLDEQILDRIFSTF